MKCALLVLAALSASAGLTHADDTHNGPPSPTYAFVNGRWWTGTEFASRTFYSVNGVLNSHPAGVVDETIDLHGRLVIPPLAEGHNHWIEPKKVDEYIACYLAEGVYYVRDMTNIPMLVQQFRDRVNLPNSIDFETAYLGFTGPGAHPVEATDQFVAFGVLPKEWKPDYDKQAAFVVQTEGDIDERFPLLLKMNPSYVKVFVQYSEEYTKRLRDPSTYGNHRGIDPRLLPHLVKLAHAANLKIAAHVYTVEDYRAALAAGVDELAHMPAGGSEPAYPLEHFKLTAADVELTKRRGVYVDTTTQDALSTDNGEDLEWKKRLRNEVIIPNLKLLKQYGVPLIVGSDEFRHSPLHEIFMLRDTGVFTNAELLNLDVQTTAQAAFPDRKIGRLAEGYEANFLVLDRDPLENLDNLKSIVLRVKQGRRVSIPDAALHRPSLACVEGAP
jgi:Amidohydrolase family